MAFTNARHGRTLVRAGLSCGVLHDVFSFILLYEIMVKAM